MILDSIAAVDRNEWNALAARASFFSSHEWLSTVEAETHGHHRYVLVRQDARLVAALPVYFVDTEANMFYRPAIHFGRLPIRPRGQPTCLVGNHRGYRNGFLLDPGLTGLERSHVFRRLAFALADVSVEFETTHAYFLFVPAADAASLDEFGATTPPLPTYAAECRLPAVGTAFDDYLATFSSKRRRSIRYEVRRFADAGLTVTVEPIWTQRDTVIRLVANLNHKYGRGFSEHDHASALDRQQAHLADRAVMFVCRSGRVPIGLTMGFVWGGWLHLWYAGFDYSRLGGAFEYFNVVIYEPLRHCYENGLSGVHLGIGSHHAKAIRGASVEPLFASAWSASPTEDSFSDSRREQVADYWRTQRDLMPQAFPVSRWRSVFGEEVP